MLLSPANPQFICGICHPNAVRKRNGTSFADFVKPTVMQSMSCLTGNFAVHVLNMLSHAVHSKGLCIHKVARFTKACLQSAAVRREKEEGSLCRAAHGEVLLAWKWGPIVLVHVRKVCLCLVLRLTECLLDELCVVSHLERSALQSLILHALASKARAPSPLRSASRLMVIFFV